MLILDFFINELGPFIYNQGVEDARVYIKDKLEDLYALEIMRRWFPRKVVLWKGEKSC